MLTGATRYYIRSFQFLLMPGFYVAFKNCVYICRIVALLYDIFLYF